MNKKFHYAGKYSGNPDDLPCIEHEPQAVQFREAANALTQMPKGAGAYMHKYNTFWYMPQN